MKQLLWQFSLISLLTISCQQKNKSVKQSGQDSAIAKTDSSLLLGKREPRGKSMIEDLKNAKNNRLKFKDIVWATFDKTFMQDIYTNSHVLGVKFFVGVYPSTDSADKKDAPAIILQVKRDDIEKNGSVTTGFIYYIGDGYCPPPNNLTCGGVEQ